MQGRFVWSLMLSLVFLSACGGSGSDSPNEVSEPAIDESFAVDADGRQLALLCSAKGHRPSSSSLVTTALVTSSPTSCAHSGSRRRHAPRIGQDPVAAIPLRELGGHWTTRPPTYTLSSRPPTSQFRSFTWARPGADTSRSTTRRATPTA